MKDSFNDKNFIIFKTRSQIFNNKKNSRMQQKDLNQVNNSFTNKNFFQFRNYFNQYNSNSQEGSNYIPFNIINNNILSNDTIYQKYYYINQRNNQMNIYQKNNNVNKTYFRNFKNENKLNNQYERRKSPFIKNINLGYLKNENLKIKKRSNLNENNFMNKTVRPYFLNRTLSSFYEKPKFYSMNIMDKLNSKETPLSFRQKSKKYLNIYRDQLVKIFVKNINKIIDKIKKRELMRKFYNNMKRIYYEKRYKTNYLNDKYNQSNAKYNEYKNMIYNYIKSKSDLSITSMYNILKPKDRKKHNSTNKKNMKNYKTNGKSDGNLDEKKEKNQIERLKKLQKKYGKIYMEKKREISFEGKINKYINQKTIENTSSKTPDNDLPRNKFNLIRENKKNFSEIFLKEKERNVNLQTEIYPYMIHKSPEIIENKIKNMHKRKKTTNSLTSNKSYNNLTNFKNIYNIYITKNIVTSDKKLFVNIKYISLNNFKSTKAFFPNTVLKISKLVKINYIGNNNIKKHIKIHNKKLSEIEEEIDEKINSNLSLSKRENKYLEKGEKTEKKIIKSIKGNINKNNIVYFSKNNVFSKIRRKNFYYKYKNNDNNEKS
jgi:hypothetical protein